jgi:GH43 family beta-xylosidase
MENHRGLLFPPAARHPPPPATIASAPFCNPILAAGGDPWLLRHRGYYYYTQTTWNDISIWRSSSLSGLGAATRVVVWRPRPGQRNSRNIWAPELHFAAGRFYIYYAADDGRNENHRMYVLRSAGEDPLGPYTEIGQIGDPSDRWAIDGTVLVVAGNRYFVWSGWEGTVDGQQNLYIARMATPWSIAGERVLISSPCHDWEWQAGCGPRVNEGPQVLSRHGRVFIIYSADQSWTDNYKLGLLQLVGSDPMDPAAWRKLPEPVFQSHVDEGGAVYGPGHCSFITSPDGTQDWIVYHAARRSGAGWDRDIRAQPFGWTAEGFPDFGVPVLCGQPLPKPRGEMS